MDTHSLAHLLTHSLTHIPGDKVGRALYSAHTNIRAIHKKKNFKKNERHEIKVVIKILDWITE